MVQTSNRNLGASIFALGLGSLIQAKIYASGRRNFSSLKHQTRMLQSPAFCHIACSQYRDFCEDSWTAHTPKTLSHGMGHPLFCDHLIFFRIEWVSIYAPKKKKKNNKENQQKGQTKPWQNNTNPAPVASPFQ